MLKSIRNNIIVGAILVTPVVITLIILHFIFRTLTQSGIFQVLIQQLARLHPQRSIWH